MTTIGDRIKARRLELNMSQDELARLVGYKSRSSINKIESDGRLLPQRKIMEIANALNTTPAYIMGWEESNETEAPSLSLTQQEETHIKKYRQLDADGKEEIDDIIDVKLAKLQRKAEEGVESLG
jgi:transcriptional regulator with XRE-family HTH domain